ncbi:MAG: hypothetical protein CVU44_08835 [Chloroflexi bacterium HGW-Chloroflexi-6]|nr:MAG: hypothetical protein CVU44_08835 [Chloroflexi bacterium HGW-Chloroflexi-6]
MKLVLSIIGILLILSGSIWFLQGINILPGSFMTGDPQWSINGGITAGIGAVVLLIANRRKGGKADKKND